jgi:hypothetical protein
MSAPDAENMRKLAYFAALSMIAHLLVIYGVPIQLPRHATEPPPLEARLQPAAPLPPLPPITPRPAPRRAAPKPAAKPIAAAPQVAAAPTSTAPEVAAAPIFAPEPQSMPETAAAEPPPAEPPVVETSKTAPKPAPVVARRLPRKGVITYALYYGNDKFNVGRTLQTWVITDDRYRLTSVSETTGLASLFSRQSLEYVSTGTLTASGLRPDFFGTERLRAGKTEAAAAQFDWNALTITYGVPPSSTALPANAQDLVSFMYQLGLVPLTPGRVELPITNGWKLERYVLEIGVEEPLQTPFGALRAVPVKQVRRPGQESIELWLAPDYRWLPVRIRFFDREGEPSGEQLVSEIRVSED